LNKKALLKVFLLFSLKKSLKKINKVKVRKGIPKTKEVEMLKTALSVYLKEKKETSRLSLFKSIFKTSKEKNHTKNP
jgi:hypothetical protein